MKLLFAVLTLFSLNSFAQTSLTGMWKFTAYIYESETRPLPNPDLDLRFIFYSNGYSKLRWYRINEKGFCERRSTYQVIGEVLHQKTIWLNPSNDRSCASDPDMRLNAETYTPFHIKNGQLFLDLTLDDKPFIYIFSFLPDETRF